MSVTPRLSSGLLRQLPTRFFGGLPATIQELLQNALRAGATTVEFTLERHVLRVRDDGRGLHDPQLLMTAGESGWDENVINPAGLGALSVLNPDFASHVRYTSGSWAVELTPEDFASGRPLPVQTAAFTPGFEVAVTLKQVHDLKAMIAQRRGYAPITVRFQGEEIPARVPHGRVIDTPVGPLWFARDASFHDHPTGIWESFPTGASQVYARAAALDPVVRAFVGKHHLCWQIDPACGVRPILPDRTQLIEDQALDRAAQVLSDSILALVTGTYSAELDLGALQLDDKAVDRVKETFTPGVLEAFLHSRGFTRSVLSAPADASVSLYCDTDDNTAWGWRDTWIQVSQPALYAARDPEQAALHHLRTLGVQPALGCADERAPVPEVTASAAQVFFTLNDHWCGMIAAAAVCENLTLQGQPVPFLMTGTVVEGFAGTALVLRGTPEEAERYLRQHLTTLGGLMVMELSHHNPNPDDIGVGEGDLSAADVGAMLLDAFIGHFFPDRAEAQKHVIALQEERARLYAAAQAMTPVVARYPDATYAACLKELRAQISTHDAKIAALTAEHRLDWRPCEP
ncbi:ATP-binding protein (plasmid) [Deinococcus ficus]|uniref:ATP-binding protein n=2 Tax=Deinococcus ficus TaxID=317577 RepID=A0A221T2R0_9DEIO|nr:ATP-binding protein [Deinococcus ficus]